MGVPGLRAALRGVGALRNAVRWLIVHGKEAFDVDVDVGRHLAERSV